MSGNRNMKKSKEKILFIIPSASINGAVIVLMHFYDYLSDHYPDIEIETIAQWGIGTDTDSFYRNALSKYGRMTFMQELSEIEKEELEIRVLEEDIAAIFFNSIISIYAQQFFFRKQCKRIFFVHEMEWVMNICDIKKYTKYYKDENNLFIACSDSVKQALVNVLNLSEDKIEVLYSFINPDSIKNGPQEFLEISQEPTNTQPAVKKQFTIGFSGTFELRKSADLLLPLVIEIKKKIANPKIFWIGASPFLVEPRTFNLIMHDVKIGGFEKDVHFIPKSIDHFKYYKQFDVFVMISREDPFPLVNLEMGALGIPVICFDKSGGSSFYVNHGCGVTAPFMDISAVADEIYKLYSTPQLLDNYKKNTPQIVKDNFSVKVQAPKLLKIIRNFYKTN